MNWTDEQVERINAYLDGELSAQERDAFEAEMARDDALRAEVAVFARVREELGSLPELEVPRNFTIKETEPAVSTQVGWLGRLRWLGALAALVLVCGVIVLNSGGGFLGGSASEPEMISNAGDTAADAVAVVTVVVEKEVTVLVEREVMVESEVMEEMAEETAGEIAEEEMDSAMMDEGAMADEAGGFVDLLRVGVAQQEAVVPLERAIAERLTQEIGVVSEQIPASRLDPYEDLCTGVVDVVMTSFEYERYVGDCPQAIGFQIGWDAAVVVANVDAPLKDDIAVADLVSLFFDDSARWSDLNSAWRAEEIVRFVPPSERPYLEASVNGVLGDVGGGAVQDVSIEPNGIGYFRFGDAAGQNLELFAVNNVIPSEETIVSGIYPLSRKVYVYTTVAALEGNPLVREYVAFALETVNEEAEKAGFFAVGEGVLEEGREVLEGFEG